MTWRKLIEWHNITRLLENGEKASQTAILLIISTNHRTPYGEIDIIAREGTTLVFVEVKTRTSKSLGNPEGSVTMRKQQHILNSAQHYLSTLSQPCDDWRVDVVAITGKPGNPRIEIQVFKNALYS
jgi:putative endonuclease